MNRLTLSGKHNPCMLTDIIGCNGYTNKHENIYCLTANGNDGFLSDGIAEKSTLFIDMSLPYKENKLNVFRTSEGKFMLSATRSFDGTYSGRVILAFNQYD